MAGPQILELLDIGREQPAEHHRHRWVEPRQGRRSRPYPAIRLWLLWLARAFPFS
jgi:hypothetical protein